MNFYTSTAMTFAYVLLMGCGNNANTQATDLKQISLKALPEIHSHDHDHHFRSPGKPTAPISLDYQVLGSPKVGEAIDIQLTVINQSEQAQPVHAKLNVAQKLQPANSLSASKSMKFDGTNINNSTNNATQTLTVIPSEEGIHYINVIASTVINGKMEYRPFTIPIQVGEVDWQEELKPQGTIQNDSSGRKVIILDTQ